MSNNAIYIDHNLVFNKSSKSNLGFKKALHLPGAFKLFENLTAKTSEKNMNVTSSRVADGSAEEQHGGQRCVRKTSSHFMAVGVDGVTWLASHIGTGNSLPKPFAKGHT